MVFEIIVMLLLLSQNMKCSIVIDSTIQNGIYLSDFCPKMEYCPEGAHVMCMHYNPNSVMGPRCRDAMNVTVTSELANHLLDITNAARSKLARGEEKGKDDLLLPRAYGMFRLKWDSELATFAQVLANQCILRHDLCRATKRFPDPSQVAGLVRFSVPDWYAVSKTNNFTTPGLNHEKLMYACVQALKSWYGNKNSVTINMLTHYPDWAADPNNQIGRLYLDMIYGPATHMGCGMSAYREYAYHDNKARVTFNSVLVVCNFSARPRPGTAVYNTVPPIDLDNSFNTCGCPAGSIEDDDCLCHEMPMEPESPMGQIRKADKCLNGNCDPTVVLLPIFTVEDAPPNKLISPQRFSNSSPSQIGRMDSFEEMIGNNIMQNKKRNNRGPVTKLSGHNQRSPTKNKNGVSVRYRHFDPTSKDQKDQAHKMVYLYTLKIIVELLDTVCVIMTLDTTSVPKGPSIFLKTPRFELPRSQGFLASIKRDVIPRKDFSKGKNLVNKYLIGKNSIILPKNRHTFANNYKYIMSGLNEPKTVETPRLVKDLHVYLHPKEHKMNVNNHEDVHFHDILTTESVLNIAKQRIINHNKYIKDLNLTHKYDKLAVTEDNDHKFIALLDNLEQEVKHIKLHDKEKEILDAKLKNIYGNIVNKKENLSTKLKENTINTNEKTMKVIIINGRDDIYEDSYDVHKLEPPYDSVKFERDFIDHSYYRDNENVDVRENFNGVETDLRSMRLMTKDRRSPINYNKRDKPYYHRNGNTIRQRNQNDINSLEFVHHKYDRGRHSYNNHNNKRNVFGNASKRSNHHSNVDLNSRRKGYYDYWKDDPLSAERRKYYQDKLENIERKLQDVRRSNHRKAVSRPQLPAMRPSVRSDNHIDPLYTSGGARFLHGY